MTNARKRARAPAEHAKEFVAPAEGALFESESPSPGRVGNTRKLKPATRGSWFLSSLRVLFGLVLVLSGSLAVAWAGHYYALTTPRFAIRELEVVGAGHKSDDELFLLSGLERGQNLFQVDPSEVERRLLGDPWVREVKVSRVLPSTLRVELKEHQALALAVLGEELFLLSREGVPFKQVKSGDPYDFPVLTGLSVESFARDRAQAVERLGVGLEVLKAYAQTKLYRIHPPQEVHLTEGGEVVLTVGKPGIALYLGSGAFRKRLLMAERVITRLEAKGRTPGVVFLDNRAHPERVVARLR